VPLQGCILPLPLPYIVFRLMKFYKHVCHFIIQICNQQTMFIYLFIFILFIYLFIIYLFKLINTPCYFSVSEFSFTFASQMYLDMIT